MKDNVSILLVFQGTGRGPVQADPLICIWTSLSCGPTSSHTSASDLSWLCRSPLANGSTPSGTRFDNSFSSPSPSSSLSADLLAADDVCLAPGSLDIGHQCTQGFEFQDIPVARILLDHRAVLPLSLNLN